MTEEVEVYAGRSYDDRAGSRRRYNLSNDDLEAITAIVEAVVYKQQHTDSNCRFAAIHPGDLKAMVDAHKKFTVMMDDNRTVVRRFFLVLVLTAVAGTTVYGYWAKFVEAVKKVTTGS